MSVAANFLLNVEYARPVGPRSSDGRDNVVYFRALKYFSFSRGKIAVGICADLDASGGGSPPPGRSFAAGPAWSLPQGAMVISGNAKVSQTGPRTLQIVQLGGPVVIQWRSFSVGTGELVRFLQPGPASLAVNRVAGGGASVILGQLLANGRIMLVNPAGVTVGAGGLIRVAGLVATTLELRDADLRAGRLRLEQGPGGLATILNQGTIAVVPGGAVVLVAPGVINQGTITAELGSVHLASGRRLIVDFAGDGLVRFAVDGALERARGHGGRGQLSRRSETRAASSPMAAAWS